MFRCAAPCFKLYLIATKVIGAPHLIWFSFHLLNISICSNGNSKVGQAPNNYSKFKQIL